jgi:hypothetical protein
LVNFNPPELTQLWGEGGYAGEGGLLQLKCGRDFQYPTGMENISEIGST